MNVTPEHAEEQLRVALKTVHDELNMRDERVFGLKRLELEHAHDIRAKELDIQAKQFELQKLQAMIELAKLGFDPRTQVTAG